MSTLLTALAPADIRARRRPRAIVFVFLAELAFALLVATPIHAWAGRTWGAHPLGDGVLWIPGGRQLATFFGQNEASLGIVSRTSLVLLVVSALAMQVPLGGLLASLSFVRQDDPAATPVPTASASLRWRRALGFGIAAFLPLAGLLVLSLIFGVLIAAIGFGASTAVDHALISKLGDARSFQLRFVVLLPFAVVLAVLGVMVDFARVAIVRSVVLEEQAGTRTSGWTTMFRGIAIGFVVARRTIVSATLAWAWRAALALGAIIVGAAASQALGGKGGLALLLLWLIHQAIVLARVALRASFLARASSFVLDVQNARIKQQAELAAPTT